MANGFLPDQEDRFTTDGNGRLHFAEPCFDAEQGVLLKRVFEEVDSYIRQTGNGSEPVLNYQTAEALAGILDLEVSDQGITGTEFIELVQRYLKQSVRTGHKLFNNQLFSGFNAPAFLGDVITSLTNTSMYTFEVAPTATLIEQEMIKLMCRYVGFPLGDGIFLSGGSNANLVAMFTARNQQAPNVKSKGINVAPPLKAFVSETAHYSFDTAANLLGIGSDNLVRVPSDACGRMIPGELDRAMKQALAVGERPFFVGATCGTTLHGAIDPIDELAGIAQRYGAWLHVDGSFGGSLVLSRNYRHIAQGSHRADSFGWTPHKLMNIPLICSALLVKNRGVLQRNLTDLDTDYLFHQGEQAEDLGKKSIQCGRHVDAVKLWFAWKYYGLNAYSLRIDHLLELAEYAASQVTGNPRLESLVPRQSFTVCFRYLPGGGVDVNSFNLQLRDQLRKSGALMLNYGYINDQLSLRIAITNAEMTHQDVDTLFHRLLSAASELEDRMV
ncbi:MAG: hypothetical protein KBF37_10600 [Saprospiraceae bacterium]|jgi:sulfinoalanine decarboxylase|nr:hypothetical protein [Saprospiraceae bacterium]MBP9210757.1 hypothetical protein [Saprospiraceae bacterium]MBV6473875.1 L-2,4-diaminobutyrate decarboxylase [Saprospiraceae bacterium]